MNKSGTAWRAQTVRRANLSTVLTAVRQSGQASRSQLVSATGLTRSAIGGLVAELSDLGLVREVGASSDGSPGRPSQVACVDDSRVGVLAVDIGVDGIAVAIVGLDGNVVQARRVSRARVAFPVDETVRDVLALVSALGVESAIVGDRRLGGVGVAIAGLVDDATNVVVRGPNLGWTDVALGQILAEELGFGLPVFVANDGDVGAFAEARFGAAVGVAQMVYISAEVGVGGGLVVGGRRVAGRSGLAGEVGHMVVNPGGNGCRCGSTGCWETEIGESALLVRGGRDRTAGAQGIADLMDAARQGESTASEAFAEQARWMGIGLSGLINIFDPEMVVLGGILGSILPLINERLQCEIDERVLLGNARTVRLVAGALGDDAGLVGAGELAFEPLIDDPLMVR
jgi:predicted NBD/HSP70 family sugar kinase